MRVRPLGVGAPLADADAARAAVFSCVRDDRYPELYRDTCNSPLWPRGILLVSASNPRSAVCEATHGTLGPPTHWSCDASISRCEGDGEVYLFATTHGAGRALTAVVDYAGAPIPTEEPSEVRAALADRDRVCELLDAVETDPTPYLGDAFDTMTTGNERDGTLYPSHGVSCGTEARQAARAAVLRWTGPAIQCGRFDCYDPTQRSDGVVDRLHAERDDTGRLWILASWSGLSTDPAPFGGVRAAIASQRCPSADASAASATASAPLLATVYPSEGHVYVLFSESHDDTPADDAVAPRAGATPDGRAVRVYGASAFCDGHLGTPVTLSGQDGPPYVHAVAAPVEGCAIAVVGPFAVIAPPPATTQLVPVAADAAEAHELITFAREAAVSSSHATAQQTWRTMAWRAGDALYAEVAGPECCAPGDDDCNMDGCEGDGYVAVAMSHAGAAPTIVLRRPAHFPWPDPTDDVGFTFGALRDLDGDATVELEESATASGNVMTRLVRVGAQPPGDVVWVAQCSPIDGECLEPFRTPAPLALPRHGPP